ncbi:MAG: flagellar motor protein MotB [Proteobacteria bacterium]|nr:flagellar motor protein MotB [Pseudomonadota bacterium]
MAGDAKKLQPIIVKRVKKGGHGAHGGAWKIAYADFVTAMMAFFLLMWLLGSTTEGDKKGIADYFASPLKISLLGAGSGSGDSSHVIKGGGQDFTRTTGQVKRGEVASTRSTVNLRALKAEQLRAEIARLEDLKRKVEQKIESNPRLAAMRSQIKLEMTPEGLRIQIVDDAGRAMFASGSAEVQPHMRELLRDLGGLLADVPNRLTLEGHTDAHPFTGGERGYSNWELSADRANASRRELLAGGLPDEHVLRVLGLASSVLFAAADPRAPANRRISILVMNREAEERALRGGIDAGEPAAEPAAGDAPDAAPAPRVPAPAPAAAAASPRDSSPADPLR